jgi:hypothetical protein
VIDWAAIADVKAVAAPTSDANSSAIGRIVVYFIMILSFANIAIIVILIGVVVVVIVFVKMQSPCCACQWL